MGALGGDSFESFKSQEWWCRGVSYKHVTVSFLLSDFGRLGKEGCFVAFLVERSTLVRHVVLGVYKGAQGVKFTGTG